jgi:hypothetical protein
MVTVVIMVAFFTKFTSLLFVIIIIFVNTNVTIDHLVTTPTLFINFTNMPTVIFINTI